MSAPLYQIKRIYNSEIQTIIDLAYQIWPSCFANILDPEQIENILAKIYNKDSLANEMLMQNHIFWLAKLDDKPLGFASAYLDNEIIWLKKIYLLPEYQGRGIGKALIDIAVEFFPEAKSIALLVNRDNLAAQNFYERLGFKIIAEKPIQMGDHDFIDLVMSKPKKNHTVISYSQET